MTLFSPLLQGTRFIRISIKKQMRQMESYLKLFSCWSYENKEGFGFL